jgi:hypothetical protein
MVFEVSARNVALTAKVLTIFALLVTSGTIFFLTLATTSVQTLSTLTGELSCVFPVIHLVRPAQILQILAQAVIRDQMRSFISKTIATLSVHQRLVYFQSESVKHVLLIA